MSKWFVSTKRADFKKIGEKFNIDPVIARIIRNRDVVEERAIDTFLNGTLQDLHSPYLMKDMEKGVSILLAKITGHKKIRIIGDYDIDGVCSTFILLKGIEACGGIVDTAIPHRIHDGYGLNEHLISDAYESGIDTVITCDNGISAISQVDYANRLGMTVIITDHHEVPYEENKGERREMIPAAAAVIDPKQSSCGYPFDGICGAVVAYKFIQVLFDQMNAGESRKDIVEKRETLYQDLLDFAALATVGDVMELQNENRILVKAGLQQMSHTTNAGLKALITANGLNEKPLTAFHIGFVLGPCVNATGRLDTASKALALFNTQDADDAKQIAEELTKLNDERKAMTKINTEKAIQLVELSSLKNDKILVVYLPECHESLAGIIAGRIREHYNKPTFVITKTEGMLKGSGRSIPDYNMYEQLSLCKDLLDKFGGHKMAAGISLKEENLEIFREQLNENCHLPDDAFIEKILIDVPMPLSYVSPAFVRQLSVLEPFGNGNPKPVFACKGIHVISGKILGKNKNVGKYKIRDTEGYTYDMIYFGNLETWHEFITTSFGLAAVEKLYMGACEDIVINLVYYPDINVFRGVENLQIVMQNYCSAV